MILTHRQRAILRALTVIRSGVKAPPLYREFYQPLAAAGLVKLAADGWVEITDKGKAALQ